MKSFIRLFIIMSIAAFFITSCKSKQSVAEIPQGANIPASAPTQVVTESNSGVVKRTEEPVYTNVPAPRDEKFSMAEGETNHEAFSKKYHVVVGSFRSQDNAKGLQRNLNAEGNNVLIVVNEQGMFRVLIESFNDYDQAHAKIRTIKNRFSDAWVLIQKL